MEIDIDLSASLDTLTKELQTQRRLRTAAKRAEYPRSIPITGSAICGSSGLCVIGFDNAGPDQGTYWNIRRLAVGGLSTTTAAAGRVDIFVSASDLRTDTALAQQGLQGWADYLDGVNNKMPNVAYYGRDEVKLQFQEKLYVVISSGTNAQQYVATGLAEQFMESAAMQDFSQ